jgi:CDP-paratose 2-epimerase
LYLFDFYYFTVIISGSHYTVFGYKGKQVRDNIYSYDLVNMFYHFYLGPRQGVVYNAGGGRHSNSSMKEAIILCEKIVGKKMNHSYVEDNRIGDHIWYISNVSKFKNHYPNWNYKFNLVNILEQIFTREIQNKEGARYFV